MSGAFHSTSVRAFLEADSTSLSISLIGRLVDALSEADRRTLRSYKATVEMLQVALRTIGDTFPRAMNWTLFFEFQLPRRMKRFDLVILAEDRIFVAEFKTGLGLAKRAAIAQVEDYALDLRDFHETSANRLIIPLVIGKVDQTAAPSVSIVNGSAVAETSVVAIEQLPNFLLTASTLKHRFDPSPLHPGIWERGRYMPVPSILEAALQLYQSHEVREIAEFTAGAESLRHTVEAIQDVISRARQANERAVCFVTGVPGSGKTLAGLSAVHSATGDQAEDLRSTFLSGNVPLVRVLREAFALDAKNRTEDSKKEAERKVSTFVESMHGFVTAHGIANKEDAPPTHVIVFDEAQRAWNRAQMKMKHEDLDMSEPELLLDIMDRHNWAVIVALIGGGQEIHKGEAGLRGWGSAIESNKNWTIYASPEIVRGSVDMAGSRLFEPIAPKSVRIVEHDDLHLAVTRRTIQSSLWNDWVEAFLSCDLREARRIAGNLENFQVFVTRSLESAKGWLRPQAKGTRRGGLISSSGNMRGRAHGIEVSRAFRRSVDWPAWFLKDRGDVRSSSYLEVAATEFECQGLELDHVGLCWGGDLLLSEEEDAWRFSRFSGSKWLKVQQIEDQTFILSKYRVLLTRARRGLVIWVPSKLENDPTIWESHFDRLYDALIQSGIPPLPQSGPSALS